MTVYDEGNLKAGEGFHVFKAPNNADLHVNLEEDKATKDLADDIESMKCSCPGKA